jgi:hypothetical protein
MAYYPECSFRPEALGKAALRKLDMPPFIPFMPWHDPSAPNNTSILLSLSISNSRQNV